MFILLFITFILFLIGIKSIIEAQNDKTKETKNQIIHDIINYIFFLIPFFVVLPITLFKNTKTPEHGSDITTSESISTEQDIAAIITTDDTSSEYIETTNDEVVSQTPTNSLIDGDNFSGSITYESQEDYYSYTAQSSGQYRFDFEVSDVNNPFYFYMTDSTGEIIANLNSSSEGVTVDLIQGENYNITISEYSGPLESYSVNIWSPSPKESITENTIEGSITHKDQIDTYDYIAPKTGVYHFSFDRSDVNYSFYFYIYDSKNEQISKTSSYDEGQTVDLTAGENYKIEIHEDNGTLDWYKVNIGVPNDPQTIQDKQFSGTISYADQLDIYYYKAPRTGVYRFDFDSSNVNNTYYFSIYDSKHEKLSETSSYDKGVTIDLKKEETYEIHIQENNGLLDSYSVSIGVPQKTKNITNFPIEGKLTYKDQCNNYKYIAPYTGEYELVFSSDNVNNTYDIIITDSKQERICGTNSYNQNTTVNLTENETYKIQVIQSSGYPLEYTITLN